MSSSLFIRLLSEVYWLDFSLLRPDKSARTSWPLKRSSWPLRSVYPLELWVQSKSVCLKSQTVEEWVCEDLTYLCIIILRGGATGSTLSLTPSGCSVGISVSGVRKCKWAEKSSNMLFEWSILVFFHHFNEYDVKVLDKYFELICMLHFSGDV